MFFTCPKKSSCTLHLYVLTGQSNSQGPASVSDLTDVSDASPVYGVSFFERAIRYQNLTTDYENPLGGPVTTHLKSGVPAIGPEMAIARGLLELKSTCWGNEECSAVALLKIGSGGIPVSEFLLGTSFSSMYYQCILEQVSALSNSFCDVVCEQVYVVHGENDSSNQQQADEYANNFTQWMTEFNDQLNCDFTPIFAQLKTNNGSSRDVGAAQINSDIQSAGYLVTPDNDDLTTFDGIHYSADSNQTLGNRLVDISKGLCQPLN